MGEKIFQEYVTANQVPRMVCAQETTRSDFDLLAIGVRSIGVGLVGKAGGLGPGERLVLSRYKAAGVPVALNVNLVPATEDCCAIVPMAGAGGGPPSGPTR